MLNQKQIERIESTIEASLRNKFKRYKPESKHMPFHFRLLGKDRMALYSFIQSLNTTFGTSIFEPVATEVAKSSFPIVQMQYKVGTKLSIEAQRQIDTIINKLSSSETDANFHEEVESLRAVCQGEANTTKPVKADLFVEDEKGQKFLFDLKTAKPNISSFKDHKRTLLTWNAMALYNDPTTTVTSIIAIPYNPYEPKPYERWTLKGMLDIEYELKVADEFWDYLGGKGTYLALLDCFERVGMRLRSEIDDYFSKFTI